MIGWLKNHLALKLVALALAVLLWLFVYSITTARRIIDDVPLTIEAPRDMLVLDSSVTTLGVSVRGRPEEIRQLQREDLGAVVDLRDKTRTGEWVVRLSRSMVHHPPHLQVIDVEPRRMSVTLDQLVTRELPVRPELTGEPAEGFVVERVNVKPQTVRVAGPKSKLDQTPAVPTLPIDVTGRRTSFRERVELEPLQAEAAGLPRVWVVADVRIREAGPGETRPAAPAEKP